MVKFVNSYYLQVERVEGIQFVGLKQRRQTSRERERRRASNPNKGRRQVVRGRERASSSLVTKGIRQVLPGRGGGGRSVRWLTKGNVK